MKIFFQTIFFFFFLNLLLYFWLHWISIAAKTLVALSGGSLFVAVFGLLIVVASLVEEHKL